MKKRSLVTILTIIVLSSMLLAACAPVATEVPPADPPAPATELPATEASPTEAPPATEEPAPVIITDSSGNVVELAKVPERIVIAGKATPFTLSTTYVFEEASERVVAQELRGLTMPDFLKLIDPKYDDKIKLETDSSAEQIAPVKPDIVIVKNYVVKAMQEPLGKLGIPVVGLNMETPEVFYKDIEMLGQLFDAPERASEVNAYFQEKVAAVQSAMEGLTEEEKPTVLVIQYSEKDGEVAFKVPPSSYIQTTMVKDGGGIPVWVGNVVEDESNWIVVNFEQIAVWNPNIILVINYNGNPQETAETLMQNDLWMELDAVKEGKVYGFGKDYQGWDLPDPRWVLGYTWVATKIHPERMTDTDIYAMVKEFYKFMYRLTDEQIDTIVMPYVVAP